MNYEQMSDEDINTEVLRVLYGDVVDYWSLSNCGTYLYDCGPVGDAFYKIELKDYCNNPAHAWSVIFENNISLLSPSNATSEWFAGYGREQIEYEADFYPIEVWAENPLRAAMIVFLMMNGDNDVL
jgi:hypothetical protein